MRIGSGALRGRKLRTPKGQETRPTSGRLKKSLFDVLAAELPEASVLDLFAGAGALGLEALSRGAASAVFVERGRRAAEAIRENIETLGLSERAHVVKADVRAALSKLSDTEPRFDVVFADPPYAGGDVERTLSALGESSILGESALVVVEHHHKLELRDDFGALRRERTLKSGESCFTLYRRVC